MNNAKECRPAATRAALKAGNASIKAATLIVGATDTAGNTIPPFNRMPTQAELNEGCRKANRVFRSRRAGLAWRKTRRQQRS